VQGGFLGGPAQELCLLTSGHPIQPPGPPDPAKKPGGGANGVSAKGANGIGAKGGTTNGIGDKGGATNGIAASANGNSHLGAKPPSCIKSAAKRKKLKVAFADESPKAPDKPPILHPSWAKLVHAQIHNVTGRI
jgi:hypothetical protein